MDNKKITLKQTVTDKDGNQQIKTISTYTDEAILNAETNINSKITANTANISANTSEIAKLKEEYYSTYALWRFSGTYLEYTEYKIGINNFLNASKIDGMFSNANVGPVDSGRPDSRDITIPSFKNRIISANFAFSFSGLSYVSFKSNAFLGHNIFYQSNMKSLSVLDGEEVKLFGNCDYCFYGCTNLHEIGAFDLSEATSLKSAFSAIAYLRKIHCKNFPVSFDISYSSHNNTFKESALVEIIGNLVDLTGKTAQTLTMGATYLAKLTDEEKKVATDKNWILA